MTKGTKLTQNSITVLERRYLRKDEHGNLSETPEQLFKRVADNIAKADLLYDKNADVKKTAQKFYELMTSLSFLPNSPTLMNAGTDIQQLSACFVLPIEDTMEGIFEAIKNTAIIHKTGGGTGFSFSRLRPKNDMVKSTKGVSSGPMSFMQVFDTATEAVKQGGKRRGANMGILRVDHPDILEFITYKTDMTKLTNFNVSVAITEEFMQAVFEDGEYNLYNPRNKKKAGTLNARAVFDLIVNSAWKSGEPGIIFIDRMNEYNPTPKLGEYESTNPCGEQVLLPYESCNLGSVNLLAMLKDGSIDYDKLRETVHASVHFLDNVIDMNKFPLKQIEEITKGNRKIGLGVMGWADMLLELHIPYESPEAFELAEKVMGFVNDESKKMSAKLAEERGVFPNWEMSIYKDRGQKIRNATTTTIAPTGTISMIAGVSSGIEPLFAIAFTRTVMDNDKLIEVNPLFEKALKAKAVYSKKIIEKVSEHGSVRDIEEVPADIRAYFVTSHDITPVGHIRMQAAFQKHTDNAVSKTINFSNSATVDEVRESYILAYHEKVKGLTIYRDGSRDAQVLTLGTTEKKQDAGQPHTQELKPRSRPEVVWGTTEKIATGCGNLFVTVNEDEDGLFEVFARLGKTGGCAASQTEAISRLVSLALRSGVDPHEVKAQLKGIRCQSPMWQKGELILSCPDAIGRAIDSYINRKSAMPEVTRETKQDVKYEAKPTDIVAAPQKHNTEAGGLDVCPDCGSSLAYEEGCLKCYSCGYSKCS